jgi:hypothetical protein
MIYRSYEMATYRRRQYYIDKIFQNRFLMLFLFLGLLGVIANYLFMHFYLKADIEKYIYKSHINIDNVNQSIAGNLLDFNLLLILIIMLFALIFYSIIRIRIQRFFEKVYYALFIRLGHSELNDFNYHLPKMFQDIDNVLERLLKKVDEKIKEENSYIDNVKLYLENPVNDNLKKL